MKAAWQDPAAVVRAFCTAIADRDAAGIEALLAPGVSYHNVPLAPVHGRPAVLTELARQFAAYDSLEFRIDRLASDGSVVMTERTDVLVRKAATVEMPVMGAFEVADGRITAWRDYFDLGQFTTLSAAAVARTESGKWSAQTSP